MKFFFLIVGVTGPRRVKDGLGVSGRFTASTKSAAIREDKN